jgi:hypothetical protein
VLVSRWKQPALSLGCLGRKLKKLLAVQALLSGELVAVLVLPPNEL